MSLHITSPDIEIQKLHQGFGVTVLRFPVTLAKDHPGPYRDAYACRTLADVLSVIENEAWQ